MPNIASVLKQEISRLSRKELRGHVRAARKTTSQFRVRIAQLKSELESLRKEVLALKRKIGRAHV